MSIDVFTHRDIQHLGPIERFGDDAPADLLQLDEIVTVDACAHCGFACHVRHRSTKYFATKTSRTWYKDK